MFADLKFHIVDDDNATIESLSLLLTRLVTGPHRVVRVEC